MVYSSLASRNTMKQQNSTSVYLEENLYSDVEGRNTPLPDPRYRYVIL